jgi:hypothetical protein
MVGPRPRRLARSLPTVEFPPAEFRALKARPVDELWGAAAALLEAQRHDPDFGWAAQLFEVADEYEAFFRDLHWTVWRDPAGPFLLGDMPVIVNRTKRICRAPIGCRTAIAGAPAPARHTARIVFCGPASPDFVDEMRYGMAGFATRWRVGPDPAALGRFAPYLGSFALEDG